MNLSARVHIAPWVGGARGGHNHCLQSESSHRAPHGGVYKIREINDVMFVKLPSASCGKRTAAHKFDWIKSVWHSFLCLDYSLLALSLFPGDVCVLWLRMKFIAFRLCHGYDSLKLSKNLQPAICRIVGRKGTISESQIVFVSLSLGNNFEPFLPFPKLSVKMLKSVAVIKRPRKSFIYFYLLSDREIA